MWASQSRMPLAAVSSIPSQSRQSNLFAALETVKIQQSHKHPTLVTVIVDGYKSHLEATSPPIQYPEHHWQLPNSESQKDEKSLIRLHTLDIYFWTIEDAYSFVDIVRNLVQLGQLEVLDTPKAHEEAMSPVVQQLETIAILDPAYHNGQSKSSGSTATAFAPLNMPDQRAGIPKAESQDDYKPLAYNPAAPPAPEPIKHREKTPPPPDSETGTGLAAAAYHDHTLTSQQPSSLSNSTYGHSQHGYVGSPQQDHRGSSLPYVPPPPQSSANANPYSNALTLTSPPKSSGSSPAPHIKPSSISFSPPPKDPKAHLYGKDLGAPDSPATEILGNSYITGPPQPLQHLQPQYADYLETRHQSPKPEGGYSDYQYSQAPHHHKHHSHDNEYDVHNQAYRPTAEEAYSHKHKHRKHSESPSGQSSGRLEQKADKVEKGVSRFLKKLEKKVG